MKRKELTFGLPFVALSFSLEDRLGRVKCPLLSFVLPLEFFISSELSRGLSFSSAKLGACNEPLVLVNSADSTALIPELLSVISSCRFLDDDLVLLTTEMSFPLPPVASTASSAGPRFRDGLVLFLLSIFF